MHFHGNTINSIHSLYRNGYTPEMIANKRQIPLSEVERVLDCVNRGQLKEYARNGPQGVGYRLMRDAEKIASPLLRKRQVRVVAANFADVFPEWRGLV